MLKKKIVVPDIYLFLILLPVSLRFMCMSDFNFLRGILASEVSLINGCHNNKSIHVYKYIEEINSVCYEVSHHDVQFAAILKIRLYYCV